MIGAYAVVVIGLALYAVSLLQRLRSIRRRLGSSGGATPARRNSDDR